MSLRSGFARLLPLAAIFGLGVGIGALLVSARPVREPEHILPRLPGDDTSVPRDDLFECTTDCAEMVCAPVHDILDADGRRWDLANVPGHELRGLRLAGAYWILAD